VYAQAFYSRIYPLILLYVTLATSPLPAQTGGAAWGFHCYKPTTQGGEKMKEWTQFMVVHRDPGIPWESVEQNWGKLAKVESAKWVRTYFNREKGVRYCIWLAPGNDTLTDLFKALEVSFESILDVEETVPDLWGKRWEEHLKAEKTADTLAF